MNENLNTLLNVSSFKQEFLQEIADLQESLSKPHNEESIFNSFEKELSIKS